MRIRVPLLYDALLYPFELLFVRKWRRRLWSQVVGSRVLEIGVGTGLNSRFYGGRRFVTALEIEEAGLYWARQRARKQQVQAKFVIGDVEDLPFQEESFDAVVGTFVFCSVEEPHQGLAELHRVLKKDGELLLLEHTRSAGKLGRIMDALSWPLYWMFDEHIARETDKFLPQAGFVNISVQPLLMDVVKLIRAEKENS